MVIDFTVQDVIHRITTKFMHAFLPDAKKLYNLRAGTGGCLTPLAWRTGVPDTAILKVSDTACRARHPTSLRMSGTKWAHDRAIADWEKVLFNPNHADAWNNLEVL